MESTKRKLSVDQYISEYLKSDPEFSVFIELINKVLSETKADMCDLPDLMDVDNCPEKFLPLLGYMVGYIYDPKMDTSIQRQVIKHIFRAYHIRGTIESIENAGTYGDNEYWVGGNLFIPGINKSNSTPASVILTNTRMFTHSVSKFSGIDKYSSQYWRDGVLQITIPEVNETIITEVLATIPAGMKAYFTINIDMSTHGGLPSFEDIQLTSEYLLQSFLLIKYSDTYTDNNLFSGLRPNRCRSGRQITQSEYILELKTRVDFTYGVNDNTEVDFRPIYRGCPRRSVKAPRSGKYAQSGSFTGDHQVGLINLSREPIIISPLYPISSVADMMVTDIGIDDLSPVDLVLEITTINNKGGSN